MNEKEKKEKKEIEVMPEIFASADTEQKGIVPYQGISAQRFTKEEEQVLREPIKTDEIQIKPDGLLYMPQIFYRRRLLNAFGPGAWAIYIMSDHYDKGKSKIYVRGQLYINGRFIAEAIGEQMYIQTNKKMSEATAFEGAKSDLLTRCCKDLGIAYELWEPNFIKEYKNKFAIQKGMVWQLKKAIPQTENNAIPPKNNVIPDNKEPTLAGLTEAIATVGSKIVLWNKVVTVCEKIGIPTTWLFQKYKVTAVSELTIENILDIRINIQKINRKLTTIEKLFPPDEYKKDELAESFNKQVAKLKKDIQGWKELFKEKNQETVFEYVLNAHTKNYEKESAEVEVLETIITELEQGWKGIQEELINEKSNH